MYRTSKQKMVQRTSLSAVLALGVLAAGIGVAGASTHPKHHVKAHTHVSLKVTGKTHASLHKHSGGKSVAAHDNAPGLNGTAGTQAQDNGSGVAQDNSGVITAVTSSSVTIQTDAGTTVTYVIDPSTTVTMNDTAGTASELAVGESVDISGSDSATTATADSIDIQLAEVSGQVTAVSGSSIVITNDQGLSQTIVVSATTTISSDNNASATLADVTVGSSVSAKGLMTSDQTTLNATSLDVTIADTSSTLNQNSDQADGSGSVSVSASDNTQGDNTQGDNSQGSDSQSSSTQSSDSQTSSTQSNDSTSGGIGLGLNVSTLAGPSSGDN